MQNLNVYQQMLISNNSALTSMANFAQVLSPVQLSCGCNTGQPMPSCASLFSADHGSELAERVTAGQHGNHKQQAAGQHGQRISGGLSLLTLSMHLHGQTALCM